MTKTEEHNQIHRSTATEDHKSGWATVLDTYRDRKVQRAAIKAVERELSTYTSAADLHDLDSMLERCADQSDTTYGPIIERVRLRAA